jgi:hypothetical protein
VVEALANAKATALDNALNAPGLSERDEARGVYNLANDLIDLKDIVARFHAVIKED